MTLIDEPVTTMGADALQAAVFRDHLATQRQDLVTKNAELRGMIEHRSDAGRLRSQVAANEAEVRQLDHMIGRLQHRFGAQRNTSNRNWRDETRLTNPTSPPY